MSDYSVKELVKWNDKIEKIAIDMGLDFYEQHFEICSYEDMIGYEAYIGMPSHYPHWSYGKTYEKIKTLHNYNLTGLPYEMVINSDPCIAYLMKDNTLLLQILTISHVYAHNDFFKNNRLFKDGTKAEYTVEMFKNHANRIRDYIKNPGIGYEKVEKILNAAHSLKFQVSRVVGEKFVCRDDKKKNINNGFDGPRNEYYLLEPRDKENKSDYESHKALTGFEEDILLYIGKYGRLSEWEQDIINIVRKETMYFIPQIETKFMNEGWASYWHYNIVNMLNLPQAMQLEFLKRHNQVIKPSIMGLNPYYIGYKIFNDLSKRYPKDSRKIFEVREVERDQSLIRRYLTYELCKEMDLFGYEKIGNDYIVKEISDEDGWKKIRDTLASNVGMENVPIINVVECVKKDNTLILEHKYNGRELELNHAYETMRHIVDLWEGKIMLATVIDNKKKVITCDEQKRITMSNA